MTVALHDPKTPSRRGPVRALAVAALALAVLAVGGCTLFGGRSPEDAVAFSRVRPPVAFEMMRDNPGMPVLDLRTRYEFTGPAGHIRGAHNVPIDELAARLPELTQLKDRTFLVYCGHDECGIEGLEILLGAGFEEAVLMEGGIDAWVLGGFGTITGPPPPIAFERDGTTEIGVD
jgi:rhodanese-related sulfurtransferase